MGLRGRLAIAHFVLRGFAGSPIYIYTAAGRFSTNDSRGLFVEASRLSIKFTIEEGLTHRNLTIQL